MLVNLGTERLHFAPGQIEPVEGCRQGIETVMVQHVLFHSFAPDPHLGLDVRALRSRIGEPVAGGKHHPHPFHVAGDQNSSSFRCIPDTIFLWLRPVIVKRPIGVIIDRMEHADHGEIYVLAFSGLVADTQRRQDRDDPVERAVAVGDRHLDVDRFRIGHFCLPRDQTGLAVARDRQHDQPRIDLDQIVPANTEFGHDAGPEILGNDIGCGRQFQDQVAGPRRAHINADIAFADILLKIITADPFTRIAELAGHVAFRRFHLEHIGTKIGQQARGIGPSDNACEVEDLEPR